MNHTKLFKRTQSILPRVFAVITLVTVVGHRAHADTVEQYAGLLNGRPIQVLINWSDPENKGAVSGEIWMAAQVVSSFGGTNPQEGVLILTDEHGYKFEFSKTLTSDRIEWSGKMNDTVPIEFSRKR